MKSPWMTLLAAALILISFAPVFAQTEFDIQRATPVGREYLPGDFVHLVVESPLDTAQLNAVMPDGKTIELVQERGTSTWHGLWQVPVNFRKGQYTAQLNAIDVQGEVFTGASDTFVVGELAVISLTRKVTAEAPSLGQLITVEPSKKAGEAEIKVVAPVELPSGALRPAEKKALLERNMISGRSRLAEGDFEQASAYFRVVLYLEPENKEASQYLAQGQARLVEKTKADTLRSRWLMIGALFLLFVLIIIIFPLYKMISRLPLVRTEPPEIPKTLKDKEQAWCAMVGCSKYPFGPDIFKNLFISETGLNLDGLKNILRKQVEASGVGLSEMFTDSALEKIHEFSRGKPKEALQICDWAAKQAIIRGQRLITAELLAPYRAMAFKKILIVDDEEIVRRTLDVILKKGGGYETDFAVDGEEAVQKVLKDGYGLVLLDIVLPRLDGYEVLKKIRQTEPDLPVVFISGKGDSQKIMECLTKDHLTGLIEKPFTPEKVLNVIAENLKG